MSRQKSRVGQNRIYTPYMTVYLAISLPKIPYIHRIYMLLVNFTKEYADRDQCARGRDSQLVLTQA